MSNSGWFNDEWEDDSGEYFRGKVLRETEKAILFQDERSNPDKPLRAWLPKSQIDWDEVDGVSTVFIPQWLIREKGFL